jgi:hypothetical protein
MRIMGKDLFQVMLDPVMLTLLAASITALALVIERLLYFRRNRCGSFPPEASPPGWNGPRPSRTPWAGCSSRFWRMPRWTPRSSPT